MIWYTWASPKQSQLATVTVCNSIEHWLGLLLLMFVRSTLVHGPICMGSVVGSETERVLVYLLQLAFRIHEVFGKFCNGFLDIWRKHSQGNFQGRFQILINEVFPALFDKNREK
ncbi:hypothetical protein FKM82_006268 [Ascaphus truei]